VGALLVSQTGKTETVYIIDVRHASTIENPPLLIGRANADYHVEVRMVNDL